MPDIRVSRGDGSGTLTLLVDQGDGTHAERVASSGGGGGGSVTLPGVNGTQAQAVQGITNGVPVPMSATALPLPTGAATAANQATTNAALGAPADAAAASDTANSSIIAFIKRGLQNWTTLLARIPAQAIAGLLPVDTLATPGAPRVQVTSATPASIALTTTCRRVSMYATQDAWYSISGGATTSSHFIARGERLDFDVPASTTISVIRDTTDGSIRVTELV